MQILGVSAKKQCGKSTFIDFVTKHAHCSVIQVRFANKLKRIVLDCFADPQWCLTIDDLDLEENKNRVCPCGLTIRQLLQKVGTDWFRNTDSDVWIRAMGNELADSILREGLDPDDTLVVVPDVRFPNELEALQRMEGMVVRLLRRPENITELDEHESETALDDAEQMTLEVEPGPGAVQFDSIIDNRETTLEELEQMAVSTLRYLNLVDEV